MGKIDKLLKQAQEHLKPNEEVKTYVMGAYETEIMGQDSVRNGIFIATNERIVFFAKKLTGYDLESFPLENISSMEVSKGMMGHKISFFASGNKVKMKWINKGEIQKFIDYIRENIGKKEAAATNKVQTNNSNDEYDQIKKLAELKEEGLITEEEFNEKKRQILGI